MKFILSLATATTVMVGSVAPALASYFWWIPAPRPTPTPPTTPASVPEIDGATSLLAIAAISAAMLFVWERNRRRA